MRPAHRLACALALLCLATPTLALAESAPPACGTSSVFPGAGDVPANLGGIELTLYGWDHDLSVVRLLRMLADGTTEPVPITVSEPDASHVLVALRAPLIVGERYELEHDFCDGGWGAGPASTSYRAVEPLAEITSIGELSVSRLYAGNHSRGEANRFYFVDVTLDTSDALLAASALYRVRLDRPEPASHLQSITERTTWRILVACDGRGGHIAPGEHVFSASAVAVGAAIAGEPVMRSIGCDDALRVDPATLRELEAWEREYWDSEGPPPDDDAGSGFDGGTPTDTDAGLRDPDAREEPRRSGSCSALPGHHAHGALALVLAALVLVIASRRARRG